MSKTRRIGTTPRTTPVWPYPDITSMHAHIGSGQWRKRRGGRDYYFGPLADPAGALALWRRDWPRIAAGESRGLEAPDGGLSLKSGCAAFLTAKRAAHERGDLAWPSFREYLDLCRWLCRELKGASLVCGLGPESFGRLLRGIDHLSPVKRRNTVTKVRTVFKWLAKQKLIHHEPDFGADFAGPSTSTIRRERGAVKGLHEFQAGDILSLLGQIDAHESQLREIGVTCRQMRVVILLGLCGGFGQSDLSQLRVRDFHFASDGGGEIRCLRHKTAAPRRVPLWRDLVPCLKHLLQGRQVGDLAIVNARDLPLVRRGMDDVSRAFLPLGESIGTPRRFYDLRRTFATIAAETGDTEAAKVIMGHVLVGSHHESYVLRFPAERLVRVSEHVRDWLYSNSNIGK